jgi:hypothetical protein
MSSDVKPGNMFLLQHGEEDAIPAFVDWQYTGIGKGATQA